MDKEHLAIASVPVQEWGEILADDQALKTGTIFSDLDMPFFVTEGMPKNGQIPAPQNGSVLNSSLMKDPKDEEKGRMLKKICETSFVLDDLILYLDTHPKDVQALKIYQQKNKERAELKKEFASKFYPLTRDCMTGCDERAEIFCWQDGPCPWEGVCV